ncbi:hypothetical protein ACE6ED_13265 [Paenibacillus sp. CN-4]|uniref:hypothetical protein n=1 Tax=Paenibacillus nanchangensis TaxID=3348343 RepID=UPI00397E6422
MIIKTTQNIDVPTGSIVSGVGFRAKQERDGYRVTFGEHKGAYIPATAAMVMDMSGDKRHRGKR